MGALDAGTFDARDDRHLAWTPMIVDEQGWGDINEALAALLERVLEIQAASGERLTAAGEPGIQVSVASMAYETPAGGDRHVAPPKELSRRAPAPARRRRRSSARSACR